NPSALNTAASNLASRIRFVGRLLEQSGREIVERVAPGLPFVGKTFGVAEGDVLDARAAQRVVKNFGILMNAFFEADRGSMEIKQTDFLVERRGVGEQAVVSGLRIDAADAAEGADRGERIQMSKPDSQGLPGPH